MRSIILQTATNYLLPLLLLFSVFLLMRGHYYSGGGFSGGLVAAIAFILHSFAYGLQKTKSFFKYSPGSLIPFGLSLSVFSGLLPVFVGKPFMTSLWLKETYAVIGSIGTPLLFDAGVYFVVIGITLTIIFTIAETV
jgi:multicomponent Na+:H+ antiporter subunit B